MKGGTRIVQGKTHAVVGVASTLLLSTNPTWYLDCVWGAVGALMPDVDTGKSMGAKATKKIMKCSGIAIGVLTGLCLLGIYLPIDEWFETVNVNGLEWLSYNSIIGFLGLMILCLLGRTQPHRGMTHSLFIMVCASFIVQTINPDFVQPFAIGYASHLLIDFLNYKGEELLFPISKRFSLGLCRSDGIVNKVMFVSGTLLCIALIFSKIT